MSRPARTEIQWNGNAVFTMAKMKSGDNLERASIYLKEQMRRTVNRQGNATNKASIKKAGEIIRSKAGEAPMRQTGFGHRNIDYRMNADRSSSIIGVLKPAWYMAVLEVGSEKAGIAARPWLRPTWDRERRTVGRIWAGKPAR